MIELGHRKEAERQPKIDLPENHPLYNDIHQIARDLRFLTNLVIIGLVLGVFLTVIGIFHMF